MKPRTLDALRNTFEVGGYTFSEPFPAPVLEDDRKTLTLGCRKDRAEWCSRRDAVGYKFQEDLFNVFAEASANFSAATVCTALVMKKGISKEAFDVAFDLLCVVQAMRQED